MGILSSFGSKVLGNFRNGNFSTLRFLPSGCLKNTYNLRFITNGAPYGSIRNAESGKPSLALQNYRNKTFVLNFRSSLSRTYFKSIKYSGQNSKDDMKVFVFELETTGFDTKAGRVIEIAIRDLQGGINSCFQTLVNPEQDVKNSQVNGIAAEKVRQPEVPRMVVLIPIMSDHVKSRQKPGGIALLVAHDARRFDSPFLIIEFKRCSQQIPSDCLFLDSLPLARKAMELKLKESKISGKLSLSQLKLGEYYEISREGSDHRAIFDVNLLSAIFERMTLDLQLSVDDLLERSSTASIYVIVLNAKIS